MEVEVTVETVMRSVTIKKRDGEYAKESAIKVKRAK